MADSQARATSANADPDVQNAMRGIFTGPYAAFAAQLPAAWDAKTRNMVVAQAIARDKGMDTSGLDASGGTFQSNDPAHWYTNPAVMGPLLVGAGTLGLGAFGGAAGGAAGAGANGLGASGMASGAATSGAGAAGAGAAGAAGTGGLLASQATAPLMGGLAPDLGPVGPGLTAAGFGAGTKGLDAGAGGAGGLRSLVGNTAANGLTTSKLLQALATLGGLVGGHALASKAASNAVPSQLTDLLNLSVDRAKSQTPLFNAVNSGAYQMLPNFSKPPGA